MEIAGRQRGGEKLCRFAEIKILTLRIPEKKLLETSGSRSIYASEIADGKKVLGS